MFVFLNSATQASIHLRISDCNYSLNWMEVNTIQSLQPSVLQG
ncbi:hypothetical protein F8M41_020505, partial [Gigaspora margarita]